MTGSATPVQPSYTTQSGTAYPLAIDAITKSMSRLAAAFACHEQSTPDMTVAVDAGWIPKAGAKATEVAAQNTGTITAPSGNPRYDIVYVDAASGTVGVATGSEAASPSDPSIPAGKVAVARLRLDNSPATTAIDNSLIDDLRALGMFNTGTAAGNLVVLDSSARLPAVDGSQLTGITTGASASDMRLAFLRIAENAGDRLNMVDGIADPLSDETDIDTAASNNQTYNAAGDYYENPSEAVVSGGTGTPIGDMTGGGGLSAAFDGTTSQAAAASARKSGTPPYPAYIGKDWGVGQTKTISQFHAWGSNDFGFDHDGNTTVTITLYGSNSAPASATDGTALGSSGGDTDSAGLLISKTTGLTATPYRYHWLHITHATGTGEVQVAEVQFYEDNGSVDMAVVSAAFTADSAPDTARLALQVKPVDSITVNTDLIGWASRVSIDFTTNYASDANQLDATAHGLSNDDRVFLRSATTLPAGLSAGVPYYVINATTDALELSLTSGGAAITLTDDGTGTHTMIVVTAATLSATETLEDGTTLYEDTSIDVSGQPSGTAMKWLVETANSKEQQLHGAVLQWS